MLLFNCEDILTIDRIQLYVIYYYQNVIFNKHYQLNLPYFMDGSKG